MATFNQILPIFCRMEHRVNDVNPLARGIEKAIAVPHTLISKTPMCCGLIRVANSGIVIKLLVNLVCSLFGAVILVVVINSVEVNFSRRVKLH